MTTAYTHKLEESPEGKDVALVEEGLYQNNLTNVGHENYQMLTVLLRDDSDSVIGGLLGCTYWGYLNVQTLWITEIHRNRGKGGALLEAGEQEAIRRGCRFAHLDTRVQAMSFFQERGYTIVGQLDDLPPGHSSYVMKKVLR